VSERTRVNFGPRAAETPIVNTAVWRRFIVGDTRGQGLVEYALVIALVATLCVASLRVLGVATNGAYSNITIAVNKAEQ